MGHWSNYISVCLNRLESNFPGLLGVNIAMASDIPPASGMSTSSALICAIYMVLNARNKIENRENFKKEFSKHSHRFLEYLGCIENGQTCGSLIGHRGVGTFGGSEDHTAIMTCVANKLNLFSYCPTIFEEQIIFPQDLCFVVATSGHLACKTANRLEDYNNASWLARTAATIWAKGHPETEKPNHLANCVKNGKDKLLMKKYFEDLGTVVVEGKKISGRLLARRFDHFYEESEVIIPKFVQSLKNRDFQTLRKVVEQSQKMSDDLMDGYIVEETRWLPTEALKLGAIASCGFGAGFGGSVWALVQKNQSKQFSELWKNNYLAKFPKNKEKCRFKAMRPGPGAFQLTSRV